MLSISDGTTGHLHVSYLRNFDMTNSKNNDFFPHNVFPFDTQRSALTSLKTYGSKIKSKLCSRKAAEVKEMKHNSGWFKKGQISHNKINFPKKSVKLIIKLYNSGLSLKKVSDKFYCSPTLIKRVLLEHKVRLRNYSEVMRLKIKKGSCYPYNKTKFSSNEVNSIIKLYRSGKTKEEISKMYECGVTPIHRVLLEANVQLRNRSENGKIRAQKYPPWNKNRKMPELSKKFSGKGNPMFGKPSWNKGLKNWIVPWNKGLTSDDPRVKRIVSKLKGKVIPEKRRRKISFSVKKLMTDEHKKKISKWTKKGMTKKVCRRISRKKKDWIKNNPELAREYMKPWINSGTYGFGTYATASDGHRCVSSLELWVDEKLTELGLKHKIHPPIPNSTKFADFLVNDIYIEVDGMSKETEQDWKGKLEVYRKNKLKFIIIKPNDDIDKILGEIKNGRANKKPDKRACGSN